jgi:hypothetical protein
MFDFSKLILLQNDVVLLRPLALEDYDALKSIAFDQPRFITIFSKSNL